MTLHEIKEMAFNCPDQLEICWDKLDEDPAYTQEFEDVVSKALMMIPMLENIYTKLTVGKHVLVEGNDTHLTDMQRDDYTELVAEELFSAYQMSAMYTRYLEVQNVIKT
jgi:hypothetical protein